MSRGNRREARLFLCVAFASGFGCGSSASPAIPDPGGPFHTNVPANTPLGALTSDQAQELCTEFKAADHAYLVTGIVTETTCREQAFEADGTRAAVDGGADGGSFLSACRGAYETCKQESPVLSAGLLCFFPVANCGATVELFSACMNEIANSDPIAKCVQIPSCAEAADAGEFRFDAGPNPCVGGAGAPSLPACDRLSQECPNIGIYAPY